MWDFCVDNSSDFKRFEKGSTRQMLEFILK